MRQAKFYCLSDEAKGDELEISRGRQVESRNNNWDWVELLGN